MLPTQSSLRSHLKRATSASHEALEKALPIGGDSLDLGTYRDHLGFLYSFHEPLEEHLGNIPSLDSVCGGLDSRRKAPLLAKDLEPNLPTIRSSVLPRTRTTSEGLGVLYVVEGAVLGGRLIRSRLMKQGLLHEDIGTAYLDSGADSFNSLCLILEETPTKNHEAVIAAAVETFESLRHWWSLWKMRR